MAVATKSENKRGFVEQFLRDNPEGNVKAVNDAWAAAGMIGTVGDTLIYKIRSELGLSSKLRAKSKPKTAARPKADTKISEIVNPPGKTMFIKEFMNDYPQANVAAVNEAWKSAGFDGTISSTLVHKLRAALGLTGNVRGNTKKSKTVATAKKRATPRMEATATANGRPRANRSTVLNDMEADIDRLIFKAMAIGDLPEIEDTLRGVRRLLYGALIRG